MYDLDEGAVVVVAQGVRQTIDSLDTATEMTLRTYADVIAGLRESGVRAEKVQRIYDSLIDALLKQQNSRKSVLKAARHMADIQHQSTQRELDAGCPTPWARITSAPSSSNPTVRSADVT